MRAEVLLAWMSETGSGGVQELRERVAWFARSSSTRQPKPYETGRWLRDMSALGHVEVDWRTRTWATTPPAAALLPAAGGTAVLAGARPLDLLGRLDEQGVAYEVAGQDAQGINRLPVPPAVYLQGDSIQSLEASLEQSGVRYTGIAAEHIAGQLLPLHLGEATGGPPYSAELERMALGDGGARFETSTNRELGLYRMTVHNQPYYMYRSNEGWFRTDHAAGVLWAVAELGESVLRWRTERRVGAQDIGTLFVDYGAPLPPLQCRALVLCSGLVARFSDKAFTARYNNVPRGVAEAVARSIRQHLADD